VQVERSSGNGDESKVSQHNNNQGTIFHHTNDTRRPTTVRLSYDPEKVTLSNDLHIRPPDHFRFVVRVVSSDCDYRERIRLLHYPREVFEVLRTQ
jgi:hypothetical protein